VAPDGTLLKKILTSVQERRTDLETVILLNLRNNPSGMDLLLQAILLCGAAELLSNPGVDAGIIINDYLNVTHSFYDSGEVSLINGVLDAVSKTLRS
jgi:transcription antitermination protein NusB